MAKAKKLPSGTWRCIASFTDEEGKYKQKSFTAPTKKEAEYKANTFLMDKKDGMRPENKTLGQLADAFIENRSAILSPSTIRGYRLIRKTAFQDIVNVRLGILTKEMYQKAINTYAKERSSKTVLSAHAFYNKLLKENGYDIGEGVNLPQKRKTEIEIPTEEELSAFLNEVKGTDMYLYCLFAATMGMRKSEIVGLKWKDVDTKEKTLQVRRARVKDEYNMFVEKAPKTTASERALQMPQVVVDALGEFGEPEEYIFKGSPKTYENHYDRARALYGFKYTFHSLRHYFASEMVRAGIPNRYAKEIMGHSTENMLQRVYQHTFKKDKEDYAASIALQMDKFK